MADQSLINDIKPYVEFILSKEPKQITRKLIVKDFTEAISAKQGEDNDILMGFLLQLTEKYPEYDYDEVTEKIKSGEISVPHVLNQTELQDSGVETQ